MGNFNFRSLLYYSFGIILIGLLFSSCKKKGYSEYPANTFQLKVQNLENDRILTWTEINSQDLIRYEVFRSTNPIPEPQPGKAMEGNKIFSTTDREKITFKDSIPLTSSKIYYRVVAVMSNRNLISNEVSGASNSFFINGLFTLAIDFPQKKWIYLVSTNNTVVIFDYLHDSVITDKAITLNGTNFTPGMKNGEPVLFYNNGTVLTVYDGISFQPKSEFYTIPSGIGYPATFPVYAKGYIYYTNSNQEVVSLNVETGVFSKLQDNNFPAYKLITSDDENTLLLAGYQNIFTYHINNDGSLNRKDSLSNPGYTVTPSMVRCSPDAGLVGVNTEGSVLSASLQLLGVLNAGLNNTTMQYAFSETKNYIYSIQVSNFGNSQININQSDNLTFVKSIPLTNNSFGNNYILEHNGILYSFVNTTDPINFTSVIAIKKHPIDF